MNYRSDMNRSNIEWTETTWNPTTGCTKISAGCKNCYAERWAFMQQKRGIDQYRNGFDLTLSPGRLKDPYKWKEPQLVFVNSMSDLFHDDVPDEYIIEIFKTMNETSKHTFQILTKRIERVKSITAKLHWSKNIWLGVSVENKEFIPRIALLKEIPAEIKFISFEPLLGEIEYSDYLGIDWVLVGGESGGNARRIEKDWILSIKKRCIDQKVSFFFKQWGKREFNPDKNDVTLDKEHMHYAKGGCMIDGKLHREYPNK